MKMLKKAKKIAKKLFYFGFKYNCIYCNSKLRKLYPHGLKHKILFELNVVGGKSRDNNKCPICRSNDRERLLHFYYKKRIEPITESIALLHIAPEKNFGTLLKANKYIKYTSGDKFESGYENSYDSPYIDICDTKLPDSSFDIIICNHVLEHVNSYQVALAEIKRILKPGGFALLQVPISTVLEKTIENTSLKSDLEREQRFGQYDHVRLFGQDYSKILSDAGFKVNVYSASDLSNGQSIKYALNNEELMYEVVK